MLLSAISSSVCAQPYTPFLNVFEFPSVKHVVVSEKSGYFPILTNLEEMMFSVYRSGGGHLGVGGALSMRWSIDSGVSWQTPDVVIDGPADDRNPAVGLMPSGRIIVAYHRQASYDFDQKYRPDLNNARCMITYSDDLGRTWSQPAHLGVSGLETCSPYGRIIRGENGDLLMSVYGRYAALIPGATAVRNDARDYAYLVRSPDEGVTWGEPVLLAADHNETALYSFGDGRIIAAARTVATQRLNILSSNDDGRTWNEPKRLTDPYNHPGDFVRLSNGWLLLLYGDRSQEFKTIRGILTRDEGYSWDVKWVSVFSRPLQGDFGYPSGVVLPSGRMAIQYYWAGDAKNAYDGSDARLYMTLFNESDFILTYRSRMQ
ncbi:glycoside hydrolase [bacterium]|nr:glycoside hydrolase [bacterium]